MEPRLTRFAGWLRALVWLAIALLVLLPTIAWLNPSLTGGTSLLRRVELPWNERLVAWALVMPPYLAAALGLGQLAVFCRRLGERDVFTSAAATALQRLGFALIAASLLLPVSRIALGMFVGLGAAAAPMRPLIGIAVLTPIGLGVTFGLVFVVFAAVLREAARLAEENASFL